MVKNMLAISAASKLAGCSDTYLRRLLREGKLRGDRVSERCWLVNQSDIEKLRDQLTSRAGSRK